MLINCRLTITCLPDWCLPSTTTRSGCVVKIARSILELGDSGNVIHLAKVGLVNPRELQGHNIEVVCIHCKVSYPTALVTLQKAVGKVTYEVIIGSNFPLFQRL